MAPDPDDADTRSHATRMTSSTPDGEPDAEGNGAGTDPGLMTSRPSLDGKEVAPSLPGPQIDLSRYIHPNVYGYLPHEREVIEQMVRLRLKGWGYVRIASWLNDNEIPARHGGPWYLGTVKRVLHRVDPTLTPPRADTPPIPQHLATAHFRDRDRRRMHRAAARSESS